MIKSKIFIRFALLGTLISAIMLIVSMFTTQWMRDLIFDEPFRDRGPFRAVEHIIENMPPSQRVQGLLDLQSRPGGRPSGDFGGGPPPGAGGPPQGAPTPNDGEHFPGDASPNAASAPGDHGPGGDHAPGGDHGPGSDHGPFFDFILVSAGGEVLFPTAPDSNKLSEVRKVIADLEKSSNEFERATEQVIVRKLRGSPIQYLARGTRFRPPPPPAKHLALLMGIQMVAILFAVFLTLGAVLYSLRQKAVEAERVMRDLTGGNLKARIPIGKMDEIGQVSSSFNKMADEIEHLIEHLRRTEHARRDLLRELAHDLRTPVASLKSLIETVHERSAQLSTEKRGELLDLAMREADYFEGLVDDLLFLGRVQEPKYKTTDRKFDLREMIRFEVESISHRHPAVAIDFAGASGEVEFDGDPGLLKRLVRNALENAASFAKSRVVISLNVLGATPGLTAGGATSAVEIVVVDDGPGFDASSLASFGQRKYSRAISTSNSKRISIGLGSVIMKSIVDAYRGDLRVANVSGAGAGGAEVVIRLPRA